MDGNHIHILQRIRCAQQPEPMMIDRDHATKHRHRAAPSSVKWLVIRESMTAVLAGLVAGVGAALTLGRYVETLLYGVRPRDPWTFVIVCVLLIGSALVAAWLPARRAARTDPLVALRAE